MIQTMSMTSLSNFRHDVFSTFRPRPRPRHERHRSTHAESAAPGRLLPPPPAVLRVPSSEATTSLVAVWADRSPVSPTRHHQYDWPSADRGNHVHDDTSQSGTDQQGTTAAAPVDIPDQLHHDAIVVVNDGCYVNEVGQTAIDRLRLAVARDRVITGGFYHGSLSADDARRRLADSAVGTFLVRDSSDRARYPFALTVKIASTSPTAASSATSIRIVYEAGRFRFDGVPEAVDRLPRFDCVVELIRHHIEETKERAAVTRSKNDVGCGGIIAFVGHNVATGKSTDATVLPVVLSRPLPVSGTPSTLKHLCRRRVNSLLDGRSAARLQVQPSLRQYLLDYPYDL